MCHIEGDLNGGKNMELEKYRSYWMKDYLMGPNSLRILQKLLERNPCSLGSDSLILDLGCGTGLTSFALCVETGAKVLANDLWICECKKSPSAFHELQRGILAEISFPG